MAEIGSDEWIADLVSQGFVEQAPDPVLVVDTPPDPYEPAPDDPYVVSELSLTVQTQAEIGSPMWITELLSQGYVQQGAPIVQQVATGAPPPIGSPEWIAALIAEGYQQQQTDVDRAFDPNRNMPAVQQERITPIGPTSPVPPPPVPPIVPPLGTYTPQPAPSTPAAPGGGWSWPSIPGIGSIGGAIYDAVSAAVQAVLGATSYIAGQLTQQARYLIETALPTAVDLAVAGMGMARDSLGFLADNLTDAADLGLNIAQGIATPFESLTDYGGSLLGRGVVHMLRGVASGIDEATQNLYRAAPVERLI